MNPLWAKTMTGRSWHIVRGESEGSLCGKYIVIGTICDDRPGREKTCESCLRIIAPK